MDYLYIHTNYHSRGVNAKNLLLGQEIYLKLGYIGVVNRS